MDTVANLNPRFDLAMFQRYLIAALGKLWKNIVWRAESGVFLLAASRVVTRGAPRP